MLKMLVVRLVPIGALGFWPVLLKNLMAVDILLNRRLSLWLDRMRDRQQEIVLLEYPKKQEINMKARLRKILKRNMAELARLVKVETKSI